MVKCVSLTSISEFFTLIFSDCISSGVDHYGGDIKCASAATYIECNKICLNESKCRRWSFSMRDSYKKCFLKGEDTEHGEDSINSRCNSFVGFRNSKFNLCDTNGKNNTISFKYVPNRIYMSIILQIFYGR